MIKRWKYFLSFGLFLSVQAYAQIPVRIEKPARLFSQPSETSLVLSETGGRSTFRALEQSPDRKWIFVSDGLRYGWIRKVFVNPMDEVSAAMSEMGTPRQTRESIVAESKGSDADLPDDADLTDVPASAGETDAMGEDEESLDDFDQASATYLIKQPSPFYEKPRRNAQKYGKLEPNDQIDLLASSEDDQWARVRLVETGEEGWIPKIRMGRKVRLSEISRLEAPSGRLTHIGFSGVAAPEPWNFGFLFFLRRGFPSLAIGDTPLELALGGGINVGTAERHLNADLKVTYIDMRLYAHWEPLLSPRVGLPIELGMLYKYGSVTTNLSPQQFNSLNTRILESEFGGFIGVGLTYYVFDSLRLEAIPQIQMTSSVDFVLNAGLVYSF